MPRRGLTTNEVVAEAARLVAEKGLGALSIRELAARLDVKPASLYNHIKGADDLSERLATLALEKLAKALETDSEVERSTAPASPGAAIRSMAHAYRTFARANPELYKAIVLAPRESEHVWEAERHLLDNIEAVAGSAIADPAECLNYVRALRSSLHGFVSLEEAGFFMRPDAPANESFEAMVDAFAHILERKGR